MTSWRTVRFHLVNLLRTKIPPIFSVLGRCLSLPRTSTPGWPPPPRPTPSLACATPSFLSERSASRTRTTPRPWRTSPRASRRGRISFLRRPEVRQMAEVQYQLGVALAYHAQFDEAVKYFNDAVKVITELLAVVKADPIRASEVEELERIIPEIQEKIQDTIDSKEETSKAKKMKEDIGTSSDKPVNTIETKKMKEDIGTSSDKPVNTIETKKMKEDIGTSSDKP